MVCVLGLPQLEPSVQTPAQQHDGGSANWSTHATPIRPRKNSRQPSRHGIYPAFGLS